jgi:organic hydroperoxide reductase OsmC/OhrA
MAREHKFIAELNWTGSSQGPAVSYEQYSREWTFRQDDREDLIGTAAVPYRGVPDLRNPEDLLLASVSACHCLTFLAEAVMAKISVISYTDQCEATMKIQDGRMRITEVILRPVVTISGGDVDRVEQLHHKAHDGCFIANSVNFPILVEPVTNIQA